MPIFTKMRMTISIKKYSPGSSGLLYQGFCASILKLDKPVLVLVHISMSGKPSHLFMVCFFLIEVPNAFLSTTYLWYVCSCCVSVDRVFVSSLRSTK